MTTNQIIELNKKYQHIGETYSGSQMFLIEQRESKDFDFQIVKTQWTKTQFGYSLRVPNFFQGKKHDIRLPFDTIKQARGFINRIFNEGFAQHWTGYVVFENVKRD